MPTARLLRTHCVPAACLLMASVAERTRDLLLDLEAAHCHCTIILVGHGDTLGVRGRAIKLPPPCPPFAPSPSNT